MKLVVRSLFLHLVCIVLFTLLYYLDTSNFVYPDANDNKKNHEITFLDCFYLATTIQAGVGYACMYPIHDISKMLMILQQFSMIGSHVLTLYTFTL